MNRTEALRILGLDEDASSADIKTAYKETAQILHPDRFATNKKLQERATEQFKNLQEAYEYLTSGKGAHKAPSRGATSAPPRSSSGGYTAESELEARLAGVAAARTQLVQQRDLAYDERRTAIAKAVICGIVALLTGRKPFGLLGLVAAFAASTAIWGVVQVISAQRTINTLNEHIDELKSEQRRLTDELDDL